MLEESTIGDMMDELAKRYPNVLLVVSKPANDMGENVYYNVRGSMMACMGMAWSLLSEHSNNVEDASEEM